MKKTFTIGLALCIIAGISVSCSQTMGNKDYDGYKKLKDNLYIKYLVDNDTGRVIKKEDIVKMEMLYKTEDDSVIMDSRVNGQDVQLQVTDPAYDGDIMEAFIGMNVGDSVSVIISADSFFLITARQETLPPFIDSSSMLFFTVKINEVQSMEEIKAAEQNANASSIEQENTDRAAYLQENDITTTPTASGLIFISEKEGTGKQAAKGMKVKVNYTGKLLDGTIFDTSVEELAKSSNTYNPQRPYEPIEFTLGQGQVIPGWDEGIAMMKEGGKAKMVIPSSIAYGANPQPGGPIKPFSTLVFDVELVSVSAGN